MRNIGRQKMASLPLYQFEKMCYDVCQEISQRGLVFTHSSTDEVSDNSYFALSFFVIGN